MPLSDNAPDGHGRVGTIRIAFTKGRYTACPLDGVASRWLTDFAARHASVSGFGKDLSVDARFLSEFLDAAGKADITVEH